MEWDEIDQERDSPVSIFAAGLFWGVLGLAALLFLLWLM